MAQYFTSQAERKYWIQTVKKRSSLWLCTLLKAVVEQPRTSVIKHLNSTWLRLKEVQMHVGSGVSDEMEVGTVQTQTQWQGVNPDGFIQLAAPKPSIVWLLIWSVVWDGNPHEHKLAENKVTAENRPSFKASDIPLWSQKRWKMILLALQLKNKDFFYRFSKVVNVFLWFWFSYLRGQLSPTKVTAFILHQHAVWVTTSISGIISICFSLCFLSRFYSDYNNICAWRRAHSRSFGSCQLKSHSFQYILEINVGGSQRLRCRLVTWTCRNALWEL